ncbi:MAG: hypothetical protein HC915_18755 [Anaerolineae bacterium]|nr:hypothetical protein [Anaerolineae bacterium]
MFAWLQEGEAGLRRRAPGWVWALRLFALLCSSFVGLVMVGNFTGAGYMEALDRLVNGEPEVLGYVDPQQGGAINPSADAEEVEGIPITHDERVRYGNQNNQLARNEAHLYRVSASRGDLLVIAVGFTNNGQNDVRALEIWDENGRVLLRDGEDEVSQEIAANLPVDLGVRTVAFEVPRTGSYTVAVVGRAGGASGTYILTIDTLESVLEQGNDLGY